MNFSQWPGHEFHKGGSGIWYRKLKGCDTWDYLAKAEAGRRWLWKASKHRHPRLSDPDTKKENL